MPFFRELIGSGGGADLEHNLLWNRLGVQHTVMYQKDVNQLRNTEVTSLTIKILLCRCRAQSISAALDYFSIMLFGHTFYLRQKMFLRFVYCNCNNILINWAALTFTNSNINLNRKMELAWILAPPHKL